MPLFDPDMLLGAMDVDWHALKDRTEKLARVVGEAEEVTVISPNGTDIILGIHNREVRADTGILTEPGSFGNLPAGEAFFAPSKVQQRYFGLGMGPNPQTRPSCKIRY